MPRIRFHDLRLPKAKALLLRKTLGGMDHAADLTSCQAATAEIYGYASWAEMKATTFGRDPNLADLDRGAARRVLRNRFGLPDEAAARIAASVLFSNVRDGIARDPLDRLIRRAISDKASDIHLQATGPSILFKIRGVLTLVGTRTKEEIADLVETAKTRFGLDGSDRTGHHGSVVFEHAGERIDIRVATVPSHDGLSMVLRILDRPGARPDLDDLGMRRSADWRRILSERSHGIVLVCGSTQSGRTTTIAASLDAMRSGTKVYELHEAYDCETVHAGTVQAPALGFSKVLREFMRADNDVIVVGEMRDRETAANAMKAADTGHLVIATMSAPSLASSARRAKSLGIAEGYVRAVVVQNLIRCTCRTCGGECERDGIACRRCSGTGYDRLTMISEMRCDGDDPDRDEDVRSDMLDDAIRLMRAGATDEKEVRRLFGPGLDFRLSGRRSDLGSFDPK